MLRRWPNTRTAKSAELQADVNRNVNRKLDLKRHIDHEYRKVKVVL